MQQHALAPRLRTFRLPIRWAALVLATLGAALGAPAWAQSPTLATVPPPPTLGSGPAPAAPAAAASAPSPARRAGVLPNACEPTRTMPSGTAARIAPPPTAAAAATTAASPSGERNEPFVECIVIDEDGNRIEELRVRGQTQRIVVRPKDGGLPYEIQLLDAGRDPSAKSGPGRGGSGQRVWPVLSF